MLNKTQRTKGKNVNDVFYFIYDGECPICKLSANTYRIRETIGAFKTIDARLEKNHPIILELSNAGFDLDSGMVVKFKEEFYQGDQALHLMANLGADEGIINIMNNNFYKYKTTSKLFYPVLKAIRNMLLWVKGVQKINNLKANDAHSPIFQKIFGPEQWDKLPPVFHKHYANKPHSHDKVTTEGKLNIKCAWYLKPFLKLFRAMPAYDGQDIITNVTFISSPSDATYKFERIFHYPNRAPHYFISSMRQIQHNEIAEVMSFGLTWHAYYSFDGDYVRLKHKGYSLHLFGKYIPIPATWLIGSGNAKEWALDDDHFAMQMDITHPLFGQLYEYTGSFYIKEIKI